MHRSHITTDMTNYFDSTDTRVRTHKFCLDAQLLNIVACSVEDSNLRLTREGSRSISNVPANIDNLGNYIAVDIPPNFDLADDTTELTSVVGTVQGVRSTLTPFDDTLPVPAGLTTGTPVRLTDPLLFSITGIGDVRTTIYQPITVTVPALAVPNRITFWLDDLGYNIASLDVYIEGQIYPEPAWQKERSTSVEIIKTDKPGAFITKKVWSSISKMVVRGLPQDAMLRAWVLPISIPAKLDVPRPYFDPTDRDVSYPRYWAISDDNQSILKEQYMSPGFSGLAHIQQYTLAQPITDVTPEPNTYGLIVASKDKLYYMDRREPLPDLTKTGIYSEPCYGLQVELDDTKPSVVVTLSGDPYGLASDSFSYRYYVQLPNGLLQVITPEGAFAPFTPTTGWRGGRPATTNVALSALGEYVFTLECVGTTGKITRDIMPYGNWEVSALSTIQAPVTSIKGLCYDAFNQLWIWTGTYAIPVNFVYNNYILDVPNRRLYVTRQFETVVIS